MSKNSNVTDNRNRFVTLTDATYKFSCLEYSPRHIMVLYSFEGFAFSRWHRQRW